MLVHVRRILLPLQRNMSRLLANMSVLPLLSTAASVTPQAFVPTCLAIRVVELSILRPMLTPSRLTVDPMAPLTRLHLPGISRLTLVTQHVLKQSCTRRFRLRPQGNSLSRLLHLLLSGSTGFLSGEQVLGVLPVTARVLTVHSATPWTRLLENGSLALPPKVSTIPLKSTLSLEPTLSRRPSLLVVDVSNGNVTSTPPVLTVSISELLEVQQHSATRDVVVPAF